MIGLNTTCPRNSAISLDPKFYVCSWSWGGIQWLSTNVSIYFPSALINFSPHSYDNQRRLTILYICFILFFNYDKIRQTMQLCSRTETFEYTPWNTFDLVGSLHIRSACRLDAWCWSSCWATGTLIRPHKFSILFNLSIWRISSICIKRKLYHLITLSICCDFHLLLIFFSRGKF